MKRRNFILSGGALATISLTLSGSMASFAEAVSPSSDFQVVADKRDTSTASSFDIEPDTENTESTHTWEVDITTDKDIVEIEADYEFDGEAASFDPLTDGEVTVEFYDGSGGNPGFETIDLATADYTGATATFEIAEDVRIDGEARITIGDVENGNSGIINPNGGTYEPTLTFVSTEDIRYVVDADLVVSSGDGVFEVSNLSAPSEVTVGDEVTISFDVTNTGEGTDTRDVDFNIDDTEEESKSYELDPTETVSDSFTYTANSGDKPEFVAEVLGDDDGQAATIAVEGGWELSLDGGGTKSVHTWSTPGIDFDENVDKITISYPKEVFNKALNFDESEPTVTIDLSNTTDVTILEETTDNGGHTATWDLDDDAEDTSIDGEAEITIDRLRDPKDSGEYEADIVIEGVDGDTYDDTVSFTI